MNLLFPVLFVFRYNELIHIKQERRDYYGTNSFNPMATC